MGIDQLVNAYKGNPAPLQAKVQQAQQGQPPGAIPPDLEEAIALQKITELRNSAQSQQAMQAGGAQPSVVEKLRQMLGAEQRQQAQPPQMPQQMPQGPQGMPPQAPQGAPQGVDALPSNVGQQYADGGIIGNVHHFDEGGKTSIAGDFFRSLIDSIGSGIQRTADYGKAKSEREEAVPGLFEALTLEEREKRQREAKEATKRMVDIGETGAARTPYPEAGKPIPGTWDRPSGQADADRETNRFLRQTPGMIEAMTKANQAAAQTGQRVNTGAVGAGGAGKSNASIIDDLVKQGIIQKPGNDAAYKKLANIMGMDADTEEAKAINKFKQQVGDKDLSIYDEMAAELKARKERLNAPAKGFDSMMEYLGQIAQGGGGRNWMEAGAKGAANMTALQRDRQAQQDALVDKILDLGAKKKEAEYGQKEKMYEIGQARYKDVFKNTFDAAKDVNKSDDEARKLATEAVMKQKELDNRLQTARMGMHDNLMSRAQALMAVDKTLTLEKAMEKAAMLAGSSAQSIAEMRASSNADATRAKIREKYSWIATLPENDPTRKMMEAELNKALAQVGTGLPNALPSSTTVPQGVTVTQVK
jgi:hypothetical protein